MRRSVILTLGALLAVLALLAVYAVERLVELVWLQVFVVVGLEVLLLALAVVLRPERQLPILCDPVVIFVVFQAQFFVVGPLCLPYTRALLQTPVPPELIVTTVLAFIALVSMFILGYRLPFGRAVASWLPSFGGGARKKLSGRWVERGLLAVCLGSCVAYIVFQGGVVKMLNQGYGTSTASAFWVAPFLLLVLTTLLLGWRVVAAETRARGDVLLLLGVLAFEVLFWGILLGQRKWLFHLFFGLAAIYVLRRGSKSIPRWVLPSILFVLVLYLSVWGTIRARPLASYMGGRTDARYAQLGGMHSGYFQSVGEPFGVACLVIEIFPEREPYRYGGTLLVALLSPIPRAVWPDKPIGLGKELTWYLGSYYAATYTPTSGLSITPTLVGDFYANLGIVGILIGGLSFGIVFRIVAAYAVHGMVGGFQRHAPRVLIPSLFLSGLVELRAEAAMLVAFYMYTMIPLLVILTFFSLEAGDQGASEPAA